MGWCVRVGVRVGVRVCVCVCVHLSACVRVCENACVCVSVRTHNYDGTADLFVGGGVLSLQEGTTQGDPLAMCMYAIGIQPLIRSLQSSGTKQVWYADDATGGGTLEDVKNWWDHLISSVQAYGYHPNAAKSFPRQLYSPFLPWNRHNSHRGLCTISYPQRG